MISREEVKKMAELALMTVDDRELDALTNEIDSILGYVSDINLLAETGERTGEEAVLHNVMRKDEVTNVPGSYTERILTGAPQVSGPYIRVKKIL